MSPKRQLAKRKEDAGWQRALSTDVSTFVKHSHGSYSTAIDCVPITVYMTEHVIRSAKMLATGLERLLAFGILLGLITFAYESIIALIQMDWGTTETFYELIYRTLLLVISVELIRTLVTHDLMAVLSFRPSWSRGKCSSRSWRP